MAFPDVSLPRSVAAWREVLQESLALPPSAVRVPPHFALIDTITGREPLFPAPPHRCAAKRSAVNMVMMPVLPEADASTFTGVDLCFPVTVRTAKLRAHAGQVSLPGGHMEPNESIEDAACRETSEEIGIGVTPRCCIGRLSSLYSVPSASYVTPVVSILEAFQQPRRESEKEVESVHLMSLATLLLDWKAVHREEQRWTAGGMLRAPCFYTAAGHRIWGLTALALLEFLSRVRTVLRVQSLPPHSAFTQWGESDVVRLEAAASRLVVSLSRIAENGTPTSSRL